MYYVFTVGNKEYKLHLSTRNVVMLEKQLGCNPLMIFGTGDRIPTVEEMVNVLYASITKYNHGITLNDTFDIFDAYLEDGHTITDFIQVIVDIYKASGIIAKSEEARKN